MQPYLSEKIKGFFTFNNIRTRLTFWFLVLGMVPLVMGILTAYQQQARTIKKEAFDKLVVIRDLKAQRLEAWVERRKGDLKTISTDTDLVALEKTIDNTKNPQAARQIHKNITQLLNRYINNYDDYDELFIINPSTGKIQVSTTHAAIGTDKSENPYFTRPMETHRLFINDIYHSKAQAKNTMTFSIPIFCSLHEPQHIIGILVARVDLNRTFYPLLMDGVGLGHTGETILVNKEAVALNKLRYHANAALSFKVDLEPVLKAAQGNTGIIEALDHRGEKILAAYTHLAQTNWGFITKQNLSELYAPITDMMINFTLLVIVAVILILIASFLIARALSAPIISMKKTARKMQAGDLFARNKITGADELADLGQAFNAMAEAIESHETLRKINDEITQTLLDAKDLPSFRTRILKKLVHVTQSQMGAYFVLNRATNLFEPFTSMGISPDALNAFSAACLEGELGQAAETKKITRIKDIPKDSIFTFRTFTGTLLPREIITIPIIIDNIVSGIISLSSIKPYPEKSLAILKQPWATGFEIFLSNMWANEKTARLAEQLEQTNTELQNQAEELEAQSEELQQTAEELHEQNIKLETQKEQVEEANRLKSQFLANMSHELRTPLNSVMALSRVLMMQSKDRLSPEETGYLEIIERNGKNLLSLINDILDLSKIEAGKMDVSPGLFPITAPIEAIMERLDPLARKKGIQLDKTISQDLPKINSDENRVHQILQNLISNAVKFTEKGRVSVSTSHDNDHIDIKISDTGIGISPTDLPHIFKEFRQVDGSSARSYEGTGLGLAIAARAAQLLGGTISVESTLKKGSTFTLTLPVQWQGGAQVAEPIRFTPPADIPGPQKFKPSNRILLVEDNDTAILQVKSVLENEGYAVDVAKGGREALDYVSRTIPGGIILDLMMPGIDGFQVLKKIRSTQATAGIPVLILTARDLTPEDLTRLSANHIQQLIQKGDIDRQGLIAGIQSLLEKKKPTLLIVEDNPDSLTTLKAVFHNQYTLLEATDGEKGLDMALTHHPDLILLDMSLPLMDGFAVVAKVKQDKATQHIPVIALTAHAMKGDREKIMAAGCDDYVPKPVDPQRILAKTKKWLEH